jgi:amino acid transporter
MSFAVCFTNAAIVPSVFLQMEFGFKTGGPVVMLYGWLLVGLFTIITGAVMAEICSTYPVAGSVYYWSGALADRKRAPFASYITGWMNLISYISVLSSFGFGIAKIFYGFLGL